MQEKRHFKMYKDGKHWVFAAITVATIGLGTLAGQDALAHADTTSAGATSGQTTAESSENDSQQQTLKTTIASESATSDQDQSDSKVTGETSTDNGTQVSSDTHDQSKTEASGEQANSVGTGANGESVTGDNQLTDGTGSGNGVTNGSDAETSDNAALDQSSTGHTGTSANDGITGVDTGNGAGTDDKRTGDGAQINDVPGEAALTKVMAVKAAIMPTDYTDNNFQFTINDDGTATLTSLVNVNDSATLVVPTTVSRTENNVTTNYAVTAIGSGAFAAGGGKMANVTKIVIGDGIKTIGDNAFAYNQDLQVVDLSENHSLETIGFQAFVDTGLTALTLPATVTSIGGNAFLGTKIASLTLPASLTSIGEGAFMYVPLTTLDLSAATNLQSIGKQAFFSSQLTGLTLPDSVTSIGDQAFEYNNNLTNVKLPANLTSIGASAFAKDEKLTTVDFSAATQLDTIGVGAFAGANLTTLTLPSAAVIGAGAFAGNQALTTVTFGNGVQSIGDSAFSGYTAPDGSYVVGNDTALTTVTLGSNVTSIGDSTFAGAAALASLTIPSDSHLTTIGNNGFYASGLTAVQLPANLTSIGDGAFESNLSLADVIFAGGEADADLTIGANAFAYDGHLITLNLPANLLVIGSGAFTADNLKDADGNTVGGLTTVTFAEGSRLTTVSNNAFIYDSVLNDITLPDTVTTIGNQAFLANSALTSFVLPASLQSIGANAFTYDDALTTVDTSKAANLTTIGNGAFEYSGVESSGQTDADGNPLFVLPDGVTSIGNYAFAGSHLENVVLNKGLTSIGEGAFTYNELSGSLDLPSTVTSVDAKAFYGNQLNGVTVPAGATVGTDAFSYNRITQLHTGVGDSSLAMNQYAAYFGNSSSVTIDTLFDTQVGRLTNKDLVVTSLTNGVTYNPALGTFNIPDQTANFRFDWSLTDDLGVTYAGAYQVVLNDPKIKVVDGQAWYKDNWTPESNFVSAELQDGTSLKYSDLTVTVKTAAGEPIDADLVTQAPGVYQVTYMYQGDTKNAQTITLTVSKRKGTYTLTGNQEVIYNGETPTLKASNYQITMSDGFVYTLKDGDLELVPTNDTNANNLLDSVGATAMSSVPNVGIYQVVLDPDAIARVQSEADAADLFDWTEKDSNATLSIVPANFTVTMNDDGATKVAGTADPVPTFTITDDSDATGTPLADFPLTVSYTRVAGEKVGTYAYTLSVPASANYNVTYVPASLTITPAEVTLTGKDGTITVGDATPTASVFGATATDENALAVSANQIAVDLQGADLTVPGTYPVKLSFGGQTITVNLTVKPASTGGNGNGNGGSGDNGSGTVDPTDPVDPADPVDPIKPDDKDKEHVVSDQDVRYPSSAIKPTQKVQKSIDQYLQVHDGGSAAMITRGTSNANPATGTTGGIMTGGAGATVTVKAGGFATAQSQPTADKQATTTLPQTNEERTPWWSVLGLALGSLSLAGWRKRRHN